MTDRSGQGAASSMRRGAVTEFGRDRWRFRVDDRGRPNDEPYILLHGFPGGAETWNDVADGLVANRFRVLAPNQRGYAEGARPRQVDAYVLPELAADVLALADAAGVDRFHLAGHDWGGFVAWYLAAHHRDRLASVAVREIHAPLRALARADPLCQMGGRARPRLGRRRRRSPARARAANVIVALVVPEELQADSALR